MIIKKLYKKIMRKPKKIIRRIKKMFRDSNYLKYYYNYDIVDNRILIESKGGQDLAGNMFYILKELSKNYKDYEIYLVANNENVKKKLETYSIENINLVEKNTKKYNEILSTAKYLFNDTSFPALFIKKEGQIYTNTWHGTPLKKMGTDIETQKHIVGNVVRNFTFSDYLVYPNPEMKEKMINAYGLSGLYQGTVLNAGYPRNSIFLKEEHIKELRQKLDFNDKQIIVYMPTWRDGLNKEEKEEHILDVQNKLKKIDSMLKDNQILYVKLHVFVANNLDLSEFDHIKTFPSEYETNEFLSLADVLITDYSSVFFDFANTKKKIILYTYDKEEYMATRGFYYTLEELPFPQVKTEDELIKEINLPKNYDDSKFIDRFCKYDNENATEDLLNYVINKKKVKTITPEKINNSKKPNTLIYSAGLSLNGLTASLVSLMNIIDRNKENIYFCFRAASLRWEPTRVNKLPEDSNFFPINSGFNYTKKELLAYALFYKLNISNKFTKKYLDQFYNREVKRHFGNVKFDKVIHYTGYDRVTIGLLQRIKAKRAILVHSNMVEEIKTRHNQHKLTLEQAYTEYDKVVVVSKSLIKPTEEISKRKDNIILLNNAHDHDRIIRESKKEVTFDEKTTSNITEEELKEILAGDSKKFINIGRFSKEKGQKRLIDAFEKYYLDSKDTYLILIGGHGELYKPLMKHVSKLNCKDNVIFIRYMSNPYSVLRQCDLLILSSFYEALGLVLLEAQSCKVPCFSTDIHGPREFLQKYNGNLVENSEKGILDGMYKFKEGKIKCMNFDPVKYNSQVKKEYEKIFK